MDFLTVREVAELLHVSPKRAYAICSRGLVPSVKLGGRVHVPRKAWDTWYAKQTKAALAAVREPMKEAS